MPDFRVDSVYNLTAIEEEQAKFLAFLAQSKSAILDLNNQRVVVKSSDVSTFTQASENLNKSVASSNTALKNITSTSVEYNKQLALSSKASKDAAQAKLLEAKAILEQEKADAIRTKSLIAQEKELERLIALEEKKNAAVSAPVIDGGSRFSTGSQDASAETTANFIKLRDAEAQASMGAAEYGRSVTGTFQTTSAVTKNSVTESEELIKARQALKKANSEENVQLQGLSVQKTLANKAAKEEAMTALGLIDAYTLLNKEYQAAAINAKNLAVQYGVDSVEAKTAAAEALALNTQIQAIDKTVGQSQKNVGNYGSAFTKGLSSVWGGLRKIAYIIPGLGIAGLISMITGPLISAFQSWFSASKKIISEQELLKNATSDFNKEFITASTASISKLELLRDAITNTSKTEAERLSALVVYNKVATDNNKIDEKQIDNLALINTKISDQIALIEHRALATASEQIVTQAATKLLLAKEEARKKAIKQQIVEDAYDIQTVQGAKTDAYFKTLVREGAIRTKIANDEGVKQAQAEFDAAKQIANQYVDFSGEEEKKKKDKKEDQSALLREVLADDLKQIQETEKLKSDAILASDKENIENDQNSFKQRIDALKKFNDDSLKNIQDQLDAENAVAKQKRDDNIHKANEIKDAKLKAETLKAIDKDYKDTILKNEAEANKAKNDLEINSAKETKKIVKDEYDYMVKTAKDAYKQIADIIQKNADDNSDQIAIAKNDKLIKLDKDFQSGKILNLQSYNNKKQDIEDEATKASLENDKKRIESDMKAFGNTLELQKELSDNELAFEDLAIKKAQEKRDKIIQGLESIRTVSTDVFGVIDGILDANATAQKNRLDAQQAQDEKNAQRQIDLVNASTASEQDKAAQITIINARLAAQKDDIARKEKEADLKKARFDKVAAIFNIAISTAEAIVKALPNIPLSIVVGALGAAQLAVAIATPIPTYKTGRGEGKDEFAIVGDGGVNEYILRQGGQIEKTPAVNTLTHLMPKDKVYPNKESLMRELMFNNMQLSDYSVGQDGGINRNDIKKMTSEIVGAVSDIRIQTQLVTKSGWRNHNERLAKYDAWVERVIKN